jgi:ATP-dependent Clp protease adaptor protein ClpS
MICAGAIVHLPPSLPLSGGGKADNHRRSQTLQPPFLQRKGGLFFCILAIIPLRYRGSMSYFTYMQILMTNEDDDKGGNRPGVGLATRTRPKTKKPSQYKVLLLNDDYTPMEFVVHVLQSFFQMDTEQATRVMLHVHQKGVGVCGIFSYEVAETKVTQVMDFASKNQHPLQCTLEKA